MNGIIQKWNDDKGFGFIQPEDGSQRVFFHISSVTTNARRPQRDDLVSFAVTRDAQQRLRATRVVIEGVRANASSPQSRRIHTTPVKKTVVDYLLMLMLVIVAGGAGVAYLRTQDSNMLLPFGVVAIVIVLGLSRQRQPYESHFSCARCHARTEHDHRTIRAWNNRMTKLYCRTCHLQWLKKHPKHRPKRHPRASRSGCAIVLLLMTMLPAIGIWGVCLWLA